MPSLEGRAALVTGRARRLGEAIRTELSEAGVSVILADTPVELAMDLARRTRGAGGNHQAEALVGEARMVLPMRKSSWP